jgi:cell division protein FtsB
MRKTDTLTLAKAMRILAIEIHSDDGVANAAIHEAAERLDELHEENKRLKADIEELKRG